MRTANPSVIPTLRLQLSGRGHSLGVPSRACHPGDLLPSNPPSAGNHSTRGHRSPHLSSPLHQSMSVLQPKGLQLAAEGDSGIRAWARGPWRRRGWAAEAFPRQTCDDLQLSYANCRATSFNGLAEIVANDRCAGQTGKPDALSRCAMLLSSQSGTFRKPAACSLPASIQS